MLDALLLASGSVTPDGGAIDAVLVIDPVAPAATSPVMVNTAEAPAGKLGRFAVTLLPETPTVVGQVAPPLKGAQLAVMFEIEEGTTSLKLAPLAALGPAFETVML